VIGKSGDTVLARPDKARIRDEREKSVVHDSPLNYVEPGSRRNCLGCSFGEVV
jgi:hypothetical protein